MLAVQIVRQPNILGCYLRLRIQQFPSVLLLTRRYPRVQWLNLWLRNRFHVSIPKLRLVADGMNLTLNYWIIFRIVFIARIQEHFRLLRRRILLPLLLANRQRLILSHPQRFVGLDDYEGIAAESLHQLFPVVRLLNWRLLLETFFVDHVLVELLVVLQFFVTYAERRMLLWFDSHFVDVRGWYFRSIHLQFVAGYRLIIQVKEAVSSLAGGRGRHWLEAALLRGVGEVVKVHIN